MEIITDSFENISITQLNAKLAQKLGELNKIKQEEVEKSSNQGDYFDQSNPKNYDQKDFERVLDKFKKTDLEIRTHEQAHATIGHTTAPISYNYQKGPDGKMYAVGGSVRLDTSIPKDPKEAMYKLDQIKKASSGVDNQSSADIGISTQASLNKMLILNGIQNAN
jgi:hypothetical protein